MTDKEKQLMALVDCFIDSIKKYDRRFNIKYKDEHVFVLAGYRDSGFGILFSLFAQNQIPSGEFHRKLHELNSAL